MQKESDQIIQVEGLGKRVTVAGGTLSILEEIDLTIEQGASVAIVGESGSGKSTLLGLLAGLDTASSGSIRLFGEELSALDEDQRAALRKGRVGFVFQSFQLMPHLNALENVMLPLELGALDRAPEVTAANGAGVRSMSSPQAMRERAMQLLQQVGLGERTTHYPRVLSGGEQQRVALARAFVTAPRVLFADEPTGSLDAANGRAVADLMFAMNRATGATLVLVTHDLELARRCQRIVTIDAGRVAGEARGVTEITDGRGGELAAAEPA